MWKPKHKFGAIACERNGVKFPSKLERACYDVLKSLEKNGKIRMFLRQIPFDIPGNAKHVVDFMVFTKNDILFLESKGRDLAQGKLKRKQVEQIYDIEVHVVRESCEIYAILKDYE